MIYKIRKQQKYSLTQITDIKEIDTDIFLECNPPFNGNDEQSFADYLSEIFKTPDDFLNDNIDKLSKSNYNKIYDIAINPNWHTLKSSAWDNEDIEVQVGYDCDDCTRSGGMGVVGFSKLVI